jgi:phosphoglycerol transferase
MGEFKNALRCSDNQIADFVDWIKAQSFYEDTLIVITGDHLFMTVPGEDLFADKNESAATDRVGEGNNEKDFGIVTQSRRRWIDVFINSSLDIDVEKEKSRFFSSFDVFPTTLAAMGVRIEGDALGFGRSLFSQEPTLLEKYSVEYINNELAKNTIQYQQFIKDTK